MVERKTATISEETYFFFRDFLHYELGLPRMYSIIRNNVCCKNRRCSDDQISADY